MVIYNCHTHIFTTDHAPRKFIPPIISWLVRKKGVRRFARRLFPFTDRDLIDRYINFFEVSLLGSQAEVFKKLKGYYPQGQTDQSRFIVLPMDMVFMLAGKVPVSLEYQHKELAQIAANDEACIPFIGVDPRRKGVFEMVKDLHSQQFKGIKLYPPMGFYPNDTRLTAIFEFASANNLPIMAHCSRGGVNIKKITKAMLQEPNPIGRPVVKMKAKLFSDIYTDPANYDPIATQFPHLNICLAHFGGDTEWDKYLEHSWHSNDPEENKSWLSVILDLIHKHDNIYTDISSTLFQKEHYMDLLLVLLENKKVRERVLFGSDYYMMERVKSKEREMALKIRSRLGSELFKQIAETNPKRYLGI